MLRIPSRIAALCLLAAGVVLVSACSVPQVASMSKDVSTPTPATHSQNGKTSSTATGAVPSRSPSPKGDVKATPAAAPTAQSTAGGDLQSGTLTHQLPAGDRRLVITYWTADNPRTVSASSPLTLQVAAHLEGGNAAAAVRVSRFHATFDDGSNESTVSDDRGDFVLTQPFSYSTALSLRPSEPQAALTTITVEFDLLIETSPGNGQFYRQTVLDTLRVAFQASSSNGSSS